MLLAKVIAHLQIVAEDWSKNEEKRREGKKGGEEGRGDNSGKYYLVGPQFQESCFDVSVSGSFTRVALQSD